MDQPLSNFISSYAWLLRQNGHGVNTPQPRALATIIRALFKREGNLAILEENRKYLAETTTRPAVILRERIDAKTPSERRARRLATEAIQEPQTLLNARSSREQRLKERGVIPQYTPTSEESAGAAEVETPKKSVKSTQAAAIGADDAKEIVTLSPKEIAEKFTRDQLEEALLKMGLPAEELAGSARQLAAKLKSKIAG